MTDTAPRKKTGDKRQETGDRGPGTREGLTHAPCSGAREMLEANGIFGVNGTGHLHLINNPGAYPAAYRCSDCGAEFWQQFPGGPLERM